MSTVTVLEASEKALKFAIHEILPNKKNSKMICRGRLITSPQYQERINRIKIDLVTQLSALSQKTVHGTSTESSAHCSMWLLPSDDNWKVVSQISISGQKGEKDQIEVTITRL